MQVVRKLSVDRITDKMTIAHEVFSRTGGILVEENTPVTKEVREKLIRNFIEEVYVYIERQGLTEEACEFLNQTRARSRRML